jgi:hypothetical protein
MTDYYHSYLMNSSLRILSVNKSLVESVNDKPISTSKNNTQEDLYSYYYDISTNCYTF